MQAYYSGSWYHEPSCIIPRKESKLAIKTKNNFVDIVFQFDAALYRTSTTNFTWFASGFGIPEKEIFPSSLQILKAVFYKTRIIGLSKVDNCLYSSTSTFDYDLELFTWTPYSKIEFVNEPEFKLIRLISEEGGSDKEEAIATDDNGGIYILNIKDEKCYLELLFRLENLKITKIVCGFDHKMVLTDTGAIYSWGIGSRGQLGHCDIVLKCDSPKRVEFFDDLPCTIIDVVCGGWHSLALTSDGDIYSWGWNVFGQLGHSDSTESSVVAATPFPVDLGSKDNPVIAISIGSRHSAALMKNGDAFTWGWNKYGQLSLGDNEDRRIPTKVETLSKYGKVGGICCSRWGTVFYHYHNQTS